VPADAPEIARIYVESWRWAYPGLLPQRYLDALSLERHTAHWGAVLRARSSAMTWLAHDERGCCGMASAGPSRSKTPRVGELYTLYVSQRALGKGVGRLLLAYTVAQLKATLHATAILWVLAENERARRFYQREGWKHDGGLAREEVAGIGVKVVRYQRAL
jgi:GNAT superfamily N-acetyltransferase